MGGTLKIIDSTVADNSASDSVGGIAQVNGTLTITGSTVSGNSARNNLGGIFQSGGTASIQNSTISGNRAGDESGGVTVSGPNASLEVLSSTIADNTSGRTGSGITTEFEGTANVQNTIVFNNKTKNCDATANGEPIVSLGNNLSGPAGDSSCPFTSFGDQRGQDPLLGSLADNGGPTQTRALQPGSPAIDAVSSGCPPLPATDQRGIPRPQDGDNNGSPLCDIGAFELSPSPTATDDSYATNEGQTLTVPRPGVLTNDTVALSGKTLTTKPISNPSHGKLTLNPDGSFTYQPDAGYSGMDSFTVGCTPNAGQLRKSTSPRDRM